MCVSEEEGVRDVCVWMSKRRVRMQASDAYYSLNNEACMHAITFYEIMANEPTPHHTNRNTHTHAHTHTHTNEHK